MKNVASHYHTCISRSQRAGCCMESEWQKWRLQLSPEESDGDIPQSCCLSAWSGPQRASLSTMSLPHKANVTLSAKWAPCLKILKWELYRVERNFTFWNYSYFDKYITIFQESILSYWAWTYCASPVLLLSVLRVNRWSDQGDRG